MTKKSISHHPLKVKRPAGAFLFSLLSRKIYSENKKKASPAHEHRTKTHTHTYTTEESFTETGRYRQRKCAEESRVRVRMLVRHARLRFNPVSVPRTNDTRTTNLRNLREEREKNKFPPLDTPITPKTSPDCLGRQEPGKKNHSAPNQSVN